MSVSILRVLSLVALIVPTAAHAFIFLIPLPTLGKPRELQSLIDALARSTQVRAVAYAAEDRLFGDRRWVFGYAAGTEHQTQIDREALEACRSALTAAREERVGGELRYRFGARDCELHIFDNTTATLGDR